MKVRVSKAWEGKLWHIRGLNRRALCGAQLKDHPTRETDLTEPKVCNKCKKYLHATLDKKRRLNQILKEALP